MKLVVNKINKAGEVVKDEVFMSDINTLYFDGVSTYINKKNGFSVKIENKLEDLEGYIKDYSKIQKRGM